MLTKERLKKQLAEMGIRPDDTVVIHTSMKAIGEVEDGPDGFLDAFCEYLEDGLFLVPTHTWEYVTSENPYYDVRNSVPNIGLIPRTAAFRRDGIRSLHPTHSVWAHGKDAAEFVRDEENAGTPAPPGFCWDKLADREAKILLIGVDHRKNTFIHTIDERVDMPDRLSENAFEVTIVDWNGDVLKRPMRAHECSRTSTVSLFYGNFEKPMVEMGVQTSGTLGNAQVRVIDAADCRELLLKIYTRAKEDIFVQHMEFPEELYR